MLLAVCELRVEGARMAARFNMPPSGVTYAARRGERVVREKDLQFIK